jgi:ATP-dependent Clp protease ATP-binding subunit ClpC
MYRVSVGRSEGTNARKAALSMFERFTDRARRVVVLAQEEARMLNHDYVGTEHILLALIRESGGVAAQALESLGITEETARQQVEEVVGPGQPGPQRGHLPLTPRAKKTLQLSMREAIALGHAYIGTEHILLGLLREDDGAPTRVLNGLGVDPNRVRQQVIQLVSPGGSMRSLEPAVPLAGGSASCCLSFADVSTLWNGATRCWNSA